MTNNVAKCLTLKKSNCKNCYKCIRNCPVKSIKFSGNQAHIIGNECILCGECFVVCPQNAKEIRSDTEKVKVLLNSNNPVIVSLAPSFIANYENSGINGMKKTLKKLGFFDVEETALGATIVKNEYENILENNIQDVVISSCCHSVNLLIQKYFPKLLPCLANVLSPMQAHAKDIKKRIPNSKVVFVGPCVSKKDEGDYYDGFVDAVLTFDELSNWLKDENIKIENDLDSIEKSKTRLFPTKGGILKTMKENISNYTYLAFDGVQNCISALQDIENGSVHHCFIEMNACTGGCIGGPIMEKHHNAPIKSFLNVSNYAGKQDFDVDEMSNEEIHKEFLVIERKATMPTEEQIKEILKNMGKTKPEHELNCGSCGYNSCREKAIAVFNGKAEISMCLPFLKDKAESFSDCIVDNTPNGLIVLNEDLEIQQINKSALNLINMKYSSDIVGENIVKIIEPELFFTVLETKHNIKNKTMYLADYKKYVEMTILYDSKYMLLVCIMKDITDFVKEQEDKQNLSKQTVEIADKVIDKQMRIVQEIASLLGETTAETKVALTKLKESIK